MAEHQDLANQGTHPELATLQTRGMIVGVVGLALCAAGFVTDPARFYQAYLPGYLYWVAISLGCMGWTMIHHLTDGNWGFPVRRIWESGARTIWLMAILLIPILLGGEHIYPWMAADAMNDPIIAGKSHYLNEPFFYLRQVLYFVIWGGLAYVLTSTSYKQDHADGPEPLGARLRLASGPGILVMVITLTFASTDWAMSIDPHWFSTIWGFLFSASDLLAAMAFTICMAKLLENRFPLDKAINANTYHDLGNLLMAFTMLWAYLSFSQFLIIWSGNTQEEAPWYLLRMGDGWIIISVILIVFHFMLPFVVLLTRKTKRASNVLVKVAIYMLIMRFVDLYWLTMPTLTGGHHGEHAGFHPSWIDIAPLLGVGGLWLIFFSMQLKDRPLTPLTDRRLQEALEGAGGHH